MSNQFSTNQRMPGDSMRACYQQICEGDGINLTPDEAARWQEILDEYTTAIADLARIGSDATGTEITEHLNQQVQKYLAGGNDATGSLKADIIADRQRRKQLLKAVADAVAGIAADFAEPIRERWVVKARQFLADWQESQREKFADFGLVWGGDPLTDHIEQAIARIEEPLPRHLGRMASPKNWLAFADWNFAEAA